MKYNDHEFDPVTDEERAAREREEELARRIRREVLRVQSGEADEEIRADRERERPKRRPGRRSSARRSAAARTSSGSSFRAIFWFGKEPRNTIVT